VLEPEKWDAYFWKGMIWACLGKNEMMLALLEKALAMKMPPILLAPLHWIEQESRDFFEQYIAQLLARYSITV
jgi:hypothetical protein